MSLGVGGLEGAPTTRLWLLTTILAFALLQLLSPRPTTQLSRTLQALTFSDLHSTILSMLLIYHQRAVERHLGPRKYASHVAVFLLITQTTIRLFFPAQTTSGACSLLAACLTLFAQHVPSVNYYSVHMGRLRIGDRWTVGALAVYLVVRMQDVVAAAVGVGAALVVAGDIAGLRQWRLPEWVGARLDASSAQKAAGRRAAASEREVGLLSAMFPGVERSAVEQALTLAGNDVSHAAAILLDNAPPASQ
ncbi:hypothetical protein GGI05_002088 [Coemansia sp. RSA 2603]|nr:hypothetical protein GGI05_002088 [Coemansia sp. RSA 2603]